MGLISLPIMLRYGYDRRLASGVIAASGTLAQIIPPSLVLIIMADQLGRSVGDMYQGALVPGFVLAMMYAGFVAIVTIFYPAAAPAVSAEAQKLRDPNAERNPLIAPAAIVLAVLAALWLVFPAWTEFFGFRATWPGMAALTIGWLPDGLNHAVWVVGLAILLAPFFRGAAIGMTLSLVVVAFATTALGFVFAGLLNGKVQPGSEPILGASAAFLVAYVVALTNKVFRLGLLSRLTQEVVLVLMPPLMLIFLVLGTIFIGLATPTEGGAMGAVGALALALAKRRLTFTMIRQGLDSTIKLSTFVLFILIGSRVFSLTFFGVDGHKWVESLLVSLPGGELGFLIVVNVLIFVLAFFLDFFELAFIVVPLVGPAAEHLGIDLIWFGVMLGVNIQTAFMHPPFGFSLFYLRSVAPKEPFIDRVTGKLTQPVTTGQIYWGAIPFVVIQLIMVGLVIAFPGMVTHYKASQVHIDPSNIQIIVPDFGGGLPNFGTGPAPGGSAAPTLPNFGTTPAPSAPSPGPNFGTPAPSSSAPPPGPNFGTPAPTTPPPAAPPLPNVGPPPAPNP
jgi:tripartite ATP-independent transporter DctM subunit